MIKQRVEMKKFHDGRHIYDLDERTLYDRQTGYVILRIQPTPRVLYWVARLHALLPLQCTISNQPTNQHSYLSPILIHSFSSLFLFSVVSR